ncbi:MAG TPA: sigma-54-dependent Fis family transcriptional regulator, partial [candidate division Zixibacteria bacterium]|nr:sigma-54-dependent Fis family transcriptional regulator [candidate division Zixibacteria bacterium]
VLLLAEKFVKDFSKKLGKKISGFTPDAASALTTYHWPGNVRELQNVIERGVVLTRSNLISLKELPGLTESDADSGDFDKIADVEKFHIKKILDRMEWNIGKSADLLGIHRNTLRTKIKEYGLSE